MVATCERQHGARLARLVAPRARILPIAAIFGGNASGKTNFVRALAFARNLVVNGTPPDARLAVEPFRIDPASAERPSRFSFELVAGERLYEFTFAVTARAVLEERLVLITRSGETELYRRLGGDVTLDPSLAKDRAARFVVDGTRENQLVLTNAQSQRVSLFRMVYCWFRDVLTLADTASLSEENAPSTSEMVSFVDNADRGQHTLLTRHRIETYLARCGPSTRSQLIVTSHDLMLMDQTLLRRDEMWIAARDDHGASTLTSFSDFKDARSDKDLRKSYLLGRIGGVPRIALAGLRGALTFTGPTVRTGHTDG